MHHRAQIEITVADPTTGEPIETTLRDLVQVVQDEAGSDEEVMAVMAHLLETGRVRRHRPAPAPAPAAA